MTGAADIDRTVGDAVTALSRGETAWGALPLRGRRVLLERLRGLTLAHADEWVRVAGRIKRLDPRSPLMGEEWLSGPYPLLAAAGALAESLRELESGRGPADGLRISRAPGGRSAVHVLPHDIFDRLLLSGYTAEVWTTPGVDAATVRAGAGLGQRTPQRTGGICAIMGAGNVSSIAPLDTLYALYAHNQVVALKLNPVTDPLLPIFEKIFAPYVEAGFVRILTGGAEAGAALVHHPDVAAVHMTGSAVTHDAIVFGAGATSPGRSPILTKPISSELGGVSPTIVVPGDWSARDLRFHAQHVATQRLHNGGYNCVASQVVVVSSDWPQKRQFLRELERAMGEAPARDAYYPGSDDRVARVREHYPAAKPVGPAGSRTLVLGVAPEKGEYALTEEFFAPALAVTELPGRGITFLRAAVRTANECFAGTLGVNLLVDPATRRKLGAAFEEALADLRYGTIAVNAWTAFGYLTARATWGAFPGHTIQDVQSGIGVVHNALLLDHTERTVVRGPFRPMPRSLAHGDLTFAPKPPWFTGNRTAAATGRLLTRFAAEPGWSKLPAIFLSALRG
ncbi:aldehyde dehydrogenase family protein [Actinoplanes sp. NPDC023936]|uniref:aldehyde dehydrogenase family protein n=1 Tax=Actinoplanes sp. NPDC023936 TaxID=3154910 RepID=UPI0033FBCD1C